MNNASLPLALDGREYVVCKLHALPDIKQLPHDGFWTISHALDEISLVCLASCMPKRILAQESDWALLQIAGALDFAMVGVIAEIADVLAKKQISIFVISTFNTDYILVKQHHVILALDALRHKGYTVLSDNK